MDNTLKYLAQVVQNANTAVYNLSAQDDKHGEMGTTLIIAYVNDGKLYFAHVGDSRLYIYRKGAMLRITRDHSLVEELLAEGKITPAEAINHPQKNLITRALGVEPLIEVDTGMEILLPDDVILLCSDGLSNMLSDTQISEQIMAEPNLQQLSKNLIQAANSCGGTDNITVVLGRHKKAKE